MWNLKNKIHERNRKKLIDAENKLMAARWEGVGKWVRKVKWIKKYKLPVNREL